MTRSLAREFGPVGIRVNAVARLVGSKNGFPLRQIIKRPLAEDVLDTVLFLASKASQMMTGQTLVVDGGIATG